MTIPPQAARPEPVGHGLSPRVEALRAAPETAERFWAAAVAEGTPLVEGDGPRRCYTFLHRGDAAQVALVTNKLVDAMNYPHALLERVPGTDIWAITLLLGSGWRGSYAIAVDDGSEPVLSPARLNELDVRRARSLSATDPAHHDAINAWNDLLRLARPDPLATSGPLLGSVAAGPDAPAPLGLSRSAAPGRLVPVEVRGRKAWWHVPAVDPGPEGWDVLVLLDGERWAEDEGAILDAWAASGVLPPTATLLLAHGPLENRVADLTCNPALVRDILAIIDAAPATLGASVTTDPGRTTIAGQSLGGLTALYAQCLVPDRIGASICQSGSLWWPTPVGEYEAEWLTRTIRDTDARLGKVHLEVGLAEWVLLEPTRRLRGILETRCEVLDYLEYDGGHDTACWEVALPKALKLLTRTG